MKLQSLGYQSELIFLNFDGQVENRNSYLVMQTLTNPNFFWGNLLVFDRPPQRGDLATWVNCFKNEFTDPSIYHITLAWDAPAGGIGDVSEFLENGYELEAKAVLTAEQVVPPPRFNTALVVKPLESQDDWQAMIKLQVDSADDHLPKPEWQSFYESQALRYQEMEKAGLGRWFGGYWKEKLVTSLGLFHSHKMGRFQSVCTHPAYRRQGFCGTLVYQVSLYGFEHFGIETLVMCADPDYHAIQIYESVGFKKQQLEYGVCWWDRERASKKSKGDQPENN